MNVNNLKMHNLISKYPQNTVGPAVAIALATTPYVRFIHESVGLEKYFTDIIGNCRTIIESVNESTSFNIDEAVRAAFKLFVVRYKECIHANEFTYLNATNSLWTTAKELFSEENFPDTNLVKDLLTLLQQSVINGVVKPEHKLKGLADIAGDGDE